MPPHGPAVIRGSASRSIFYLNEFYLDRYFQILALARHCDVCTMLDASDRMNRTPPWI
jgi:hypothetical protein